MKDEFIEIKRKMKVSEIELELSTITQEIGNRVTVAVIEGMDRVIGEAVPAGWQNVGTEKRSLMSWLMKTDISHSRMMYKFDKSTFYWYS